MVLVEMRVVMVTDLLHRAEPGQRCIGDIVGRQRHRPAASIGQRVDVACAPARPADRREASPFSPLAGRIGFSHKLAGHEDAGVQSSALSDYELI